MNLQIKEVPEITPHSIEHRNPFRCREASLNLSLIAQMLEESFIPVGSLDKVIQHEREESYKYDGRTVFGKAKKRVQGRVF